MAESRLMQVIEGAWSAWLRKLKWNHEVEEMTGYLRKAAEEGTSLDDACKAIFAEGFAAGQKYGKAAVFRECERRYRIN